MQEGLMMIPIAALMIIISGVVLSAGAMTVGKFKDSTTDANALLAIGNTSLGINALAGQLGTSHSGQAC